MPRAKTQEKELERREKVSRARRFRRGYSLSNETRLKISQALTGRHLREETKRKLAVSSRHPQSAEIRKRIGEARKGCSIPPEQRVKIASGLRRAYKEGRLTPRHEPRSEAVKQKVSSSKMGHSTSPETRAKISETLKIRWATDKDYRENWSQKISKTLHQQPNKPEKRMRKILDDYFPGSWRYTGDGSFTIEGYRPDFTNCDGAKAIIEVFGDYWHERGNKKWQQTELGKIMAYNSFGYSCLVVWESEFKDEPAIVEKIKRFMKKGRHKL